MGGVSNLLNLRFADDLLLVGRSLYQSEQMLEDVFKAAEHAGLSLHFGKTKILNNGKGQDARKESVQMRGNTVEIVTATDYLGTRLCLRQPCAMGTEVAHRVARAWAKFATFRSELTNKKTNLFDRVRLFHAVVTPCALYGSSSWALARSEERTLRTAQRRMLRAILGKHRRLIQTDISSHSETSGSEAAAGEVEEPGVEEELESWADWLKRTTSEAEAAMRKVGVDDWVTLLRKGKWFWASRVSHHSSMRWTARVLYWQPAEGLRSVGHPLLRWLDPIQRYAASLSDLPDAWMYLLQDRAEASDALPDFLQWCDGYTD